MVFLDIYISPSVCSILQQLGDCQRAQPSSPNGSLLPEKGILPSSRRDTAVPTLCTCSGTHLTTQKIIQSANPRGKKKKSNRTKRKEACWISCVNQLFTHSDKYQSHSVRGPGECDCSIHSHCEIGKCQSASSLRLNHLKSLNKALQHHGQSTETSLMVLFEVSRTNCF